MGTNLNAIPKKAFLATVVFVIILGIFLFLPAWSLNYWQGWVFWCVFSACVMAITLYFAKKDPKLIASRLSAGPVAEKERNQKIIQSIASLFFYAMIIFPGLDHRFGWSDVPPGLVLLSNAFVILGFLIVFFVFNENSHTSAIIEVQEGQKVISSGPYRIVRHPMYSGACLMLLFIPFALGSFWAVLFVFPLIAVIVLRILDEEKFLSNNLAGYTEYCQMTRYHFIPYVW